VLRGWRLTLLLRVPALLLPLLVPIARAKPEEPAPTSAVSYPGGVQSFRDVVFARPLTMDLYVRPAAAAKRPLVVFVHGGAWRSKTSRDGGAFVDFPSVLASVAARNYVVASVNYRFSAEEKFPGAVQDVASAIRWLRAHADEYGIDSDRVVVWGSSAGGQIAALLGTACGVSAFGPSEGVCVQGVIDWYGLVDLESDGKDLGKPDVPDYVEAYLGCKLVDCPAGWARSASPFPYIDAKDPPFLIQHGAADVTVAPAQSKRLYDALRAAGVPAKLVIYPGVAHGFSKVPGGGPDDAINKQAMDEMCEYLGRYFPTDRQR
jgi:acetyl esterase/lipase